MLKDSVLASLLPCLFIRKSSPCGLLDILGGSLSFGIQEQEPGSHMNVARYWWTAGVSRMCSQLFNDLFRETEREIDG